MSVLADLVRERREWPDRRKHAASRHHHWVLMGEAALTVELFFVAYVYHETITQFFQLFLR